MTTPLSGTTKSIDGGLFAGAARVPLVGVDVGGDVLGGYAHVRLKQTYVNGEKAAVDAVYTFPVPADATLTGFRMESGGRMVEGVVQPRDKAFRAYDDAVVTGHGAALLEQERKNVFTAQVGNLLPGETTIIEIDYVQRVALDEGSMRVMIPTLVAPRYAPTAAHAVSPPIGPGACKTTFAMRLDLGRAVEITSPSHAIAVVADPAGGVRVSFAGGSAPQDRDIVLDVRGAGTDQLATVASHRAPGGEGWVALSVLPDLLHLSTRHEPREITFLIDTSGSMGGESIVQAKAALRLCLRHLRDGDRFNIVAFASDHRSFAKEAVPFGQAQLEAADRWVAQLVADGGTELLAPLRDALKQSPRGVLVLLTDGQVSNEAEILAASLDARDTARVYSFGIGTNVSDQLLRDLADETRGAVEFIHPGERIEEKVVTVFSKAIASRVDDVSISFDGVELAELAPQALPALVDAEPWVLFAKIERGGVGRATLRGRANGEPFTQEIPLSLPDGATNPAVARLWAAARIRDLERAKLDGRRADAMKARIIELSVAHGVASAYTSFVVVEQRSGDRRQKGGAGETRVVPVSAPAGWSMFHGADLSVEEPAPGTGGHVPKGGARHFANRMTTMGAPPPPPMMARAMSPSPMSPSPMSPSAMAGPPPAPMAMATAYAPPDDDEIELSHVDAPSLPARIISAQLASGLWSDDVDEAGLRETAHALWQLASLSITTAHPMYGTPLKKALAALVGLLGAVGARHAELARLALGAAWLLASGRTSRREVERAAAACNLSTATFHDDAALRAELAGLASR